MRARCIPEGAALSLFSGKFKPFAIKERTIRKLAAQSLSIPLSKRPETVMQTGRIEASLLVHSCPESSERGNAGQPRSTQALPRCRGDQYRLATDAVDLLDPLSSLDNP